MKKIKFLIFISFTVLMSITAISYNLKVVDAKEVNKEAVRLESGKTYSYDLDMDGKKEKIKYVVNQNEESLYENDFEKRYQYILYINGKEQYNDTSYSEKAVFELCDVNTKDKSKELFFIAPYTSAVDHGFAYYFRYKNSELKKIQDLAKIFKGNDYKETISIHAGCGSTLINGNFKYGNSTIYTDNKGSITIFLCCHAKSIKYLHMEAKLEFKNGKFIDKSKGNFTLLESDIDYRNVVKPFTVYKKPNSKTVAFKTKKNYMICATAVTFKNGKGYLQIAHVKNRKERIQIFPDRENENGYLQLIGENGNCQRLKVKDLGWIGMKQSDISFSKGGSLHV